VIIINDAVVSGVHAALGAKKADQKGVYRNQEKEKVLRFGDDIPRWDKFTCVRIKTIYKKEQRLGLETALLVAISILNQRVTMLSD